MVDDDLARWRDTLRALTREPATFERYRQQRGRFATRVSSALTQSRLELGRHVLYGVWLEGWDSPVYIGESTKAARRLWDLAIGESHHLSNTVPPEVWHRVVVLPWRALLDEWDIDVDAIVQVAIDSGVDPAKWEDSIGQALEHALQVRHSPVSNLSRRMRDGSWTARRLHASRSRGARLAPHVGDLTRLVCNAWDRLAAAGPERGAVQEIPGAGLAVFPEAFWDGPASS